MYNSNAENSDPERWRINYVTFLQEIIIYDSQKLFIDENSQSLQPVKKSKYGWQLATQSISIHSVMDNDYPEITSSIFNNCSCSNVVEEELHSSNLSSSGFSCIFLLNHFESSTFPTL